jgi:beta-mannosidase
MNELDVQWVRDKTWEYSREFTVSATFLDAPAIVLNLDEVDTFADISINGKRVLRTENMFKRYRVDVKPALKKGRNTIQITIRPAQVEAAKIAASHPMDIPSTTNNSVPHINFVRKVQCHPGWDWGISLMVSGVYGDISLQPVQNTQISHVYCTQRHRKKACSVK